MLVLLPWKYSTIAPTIWVRTATDLFSLVGMLNIMTKSFFGTMGTLSN